VTTGPRRAHNRPVVTGAADLGRGRALSARSAWRAASEALSRADEQAPLGAADLELLARAAYMLGRDDAYVQALTRAHRAHLDGGDPRAAVRCAFWIGHSMLFRGDRPRAEGWFARARRLLDDAPAECAERGWLLIPVWLAQMAAGDWEAGHDTAAEAAAIGERFGDADLLWLARDEQGRALLGGGRLRDGLRLVDEALIAATSGELSPVVTGILLCNTIAFCQRALELERAWAWTEALTRWCEGQPEMVAHNGLCTVHRAEALQMRGAWGEAMEEAGRAVELSDRGVLNRRARGAAHYRQGEIHRLRGEPAAAERAYREASRHGREPQPGLALLRLARGDRQAAAATIRRAVAETVDPLGRAALLPAYVEIMLESGDLEAARTACRQLEDIAVCRGGEVLGALAADAAGAVMLVEDDPAGALPALRRAAAAWQELGAVHELARTRVLVALACRALGDEDTASLELHVAREVLDRLGARPDVARVDRLGAAAPGPGAHGLTARELEVLRLVASGKSNRQIAEALVLSEHTVARHLQNILAKLGVASRTAAGAFAFEHGLA
jgi:DNA-binding NarL/FixJ family response regulator